MPHNFLVFRKVMIEKFDKASNNEGIVELILGAMVKGSNFLVMNMGK